MWEKFLNNFVKNLDFSEFNLDNEFNIFIDVWDICIIRMDKFCMEKK